MQNLPRSRYQGRHATLLPKRERCVTAQITAAKILRRRLWRPQFGREGGARGPLLLLKCLSSFLGHLYTNDCLSPSMLSCRLYLCDPRQIQDIKGCTLIFKQQLQSVELHFCRSNYVFFKAVIRLFLFYKTCKIFHQFLLNNLS